MVLLLLSMYLTNPVIIKHVSVPIKLTVTLGDLELDKLDGIAEPTTFNEEQYHHYLSLYF